jgi:hypothetical protein
MNVAAFVQTRHLPMVEQLIAATGVSTVKYTNIIFEHATWLRPSTKWGFVDIQGGYVAPHSPNSYHSPPSIFILELELVELLRREKY